MEHPTSNIQHRTFNLNPEPRTLTPCKARGVGFYPMANEGHFRHYSAVKRKYLRKEQTL
jgi:hypothetical protein